MNRQNHDLIEDRVGKRARVKAREKAVLVGLNVFGKQDDGLWTKSEAMEELESLADTAGLRIIDSIVQNRSKPDPSFFIGKGKADELKEMAVRTEPDVFVFDDELRPAQARN
ncbi:GTPase HflX, partial [Candidatus Bipolaricaulota bacterium]|nr:GTPase HflX [Candidatus Bipolaricaulota bacterium]